VISPSLLDYLRTVAAAFLPDTAAIARYTETSTSDGVVQSWVTVATGVACRVSPLGISAAERAGMAADGGGVLRAISEWVVWLPALTDITERDRITVTGADRTDGRTFEVTRIGQRTYESVREARCSLVT
jgi:hypothetical protein